MGNLTLRGAKIGLGRGERRHARVDGRKRRHRERLLRGLTELRAAELAEHATDDELSAREIEVLRLIAAGNSNKQIADVLFIAEATVKSRVTNILSKLYASDRAHAATIGLKRGIIEL